MANNTNKILKEGYNRLKKILEKIITQKKEQPQLVLQPIRNRPARLRIASVACAIASATEHGARQVKYLRGTGLH
jgi:hypothetical protein